MINELFKVPLISKCPFGVSKSIKQKPTIFLKDCREILGNFLETVGVIRGNETVCVGTWSH